MGKNEINVMLWFMKLLQRGIRQLESLKTEEKIRKRGSKRK